MQTPTQIQKPPQIQTRRPKPSLKRTPTQIPNGVTNRDR